MKLIKIIALLAIGAIVGRFLGLWVHDLTYQAWLNSGSRDPSGATLGGALAGLVQVAPMLYAVVLSKRIYSGAVNTRSATNHQPTPNSIAQIAGMSTDLVNNSAGQFGIGSSTSIPDTTASPETPYLDQAENIPKSAANVACDSNDTVKSEVYGTDEIEVENSTAIATRENQHVYVPESIDEANEFLSEDPEVEEKNFPKALKVIEYSAAAAHSWAEVTAIPKVYQTQFLDAIEADPTIDTAKLAWKLIEDHHKQLRPYENEAANDALAQARTIGVEAEKEFIEVYDLIGRLDDADFILQKIEAKFGPSHRTIDAQIKQERELQERERQERERKIEMAAMFERRQRERERQELDQIEKQRIRREDDRRYLQKLREDRRAKASDKIGQAILIGVLVLMAVAILAAVSAA